MNTIKRKRLPKEKINGNYLAMLIDIYNSKFVNSYELRDKFNVTHQCIPSLAHLQFIVKVSPGNYKWNLTIPPSMKHVLAMKREIQVRNKMNRDNTKQIAMNFAQRKKPYTVAVEPTPPAKIDNTTAIIFAFVLGLFVCAVCWYAS